MKGIHYSVAGHDSRTVVFIHGWTCDDRVWTEQISALSKTYRVVTVDLPGHGRSPIPSGETFSMDLFARSIESVRAEVDADRIVLVGHSMGAPVIVRYAELFPQYTAALVFVDGVTSGNPNRKRRSGNTLLGPEGLIAREEIVRSMFSPATAPELQRTILDMMLAAPEQTAAGALDATNEARDREIGHFTLPVLAIYAHNSRYAVPGYLPTHFSNLEYLEIPGSGHFLMLEKPDDFNGLLLDFLGKQSF
jgi:pimeloyl-ACP methyl ester carboxylesterase